MLAVTTNADAIEAVLRERIECGELAPATRLADADLAHELGVSRTPVREALLRLAREGLVDIAPGRWTRVSAFGDDDAHQIFGPYAALHGVAAASAAARCGPADVEALRACNAALRRAIRDRDAEGARAADERFHDLIVELAANPHLARAVAPLRSLARRYELVHFSRAAPARESHEQHERIIDALAAADGAAAERLTRENMFG